MVTVLSGDSVQKGTVDFSLKKLCHLALPPPPHISLHDLVTPPLGLLLQEKKPGGEELGTGREASRQRG